MRKLLSIDNLTNTVILQMNTLISRDFCENMVRVHFGNFHTMKNCVPKKILIHWVFRIKIPGLSFAVTVAIVEFCWKTSVTFSNESTQKQEVDFRQTSPHRRNSRRFTSIERRRSRKSLCAEIARTLVPHLICDTYNPQDDPAGILRGAEIQQQQRPSPFPDGMDSPENLSDEVYMPSRHYAQNVRFFEGAAIWNKCHN